jgi:hypothetical protein
LNITVSENSNAVDPSEVFYLYTDFSKGLGDWVWLYLKGERTLTAPPEYAIENGLMAWGSWNDWWNVSWNPLQYSYEAALALGDPIPLLSLTTIR